MHIEYTPQNLRFERENFLGLASGKFVELSLLKVFEQRLQTRGFVEQRNFYPLWFHAEQECSHYLWRKGLSLDDKDGFEFWIDIRAFIEKRRAALNDGQSGVSKMRTERLNENLGQPNPVDSESEDYVTEQLYLSELNERLDQISSHACIISLMSRLVLEELSDTHSSVETVILPVANIEADDDFLSRKSLKVPKN